MELREKCGTIMVEPENKSVTLNDEARKTLFVLQKKTAKFNRLWLTTLLLSLFLWIGDILLTVSLLPSLLSAEAIFPVILSVLFLILTVVSYQFYKFYRNKNRLLKADIKENKERVVTGRIEHCAYDANGISVQVDGEKLQVNCGVTFLGYKLIHFELSQKYLSQVRYLPHSGLLYGITFSHTDPLETTTQDNQQGKRMLSGSVTMVVVHKYSLPLQFQMADFTLRNVQIGNTLLVWHKDQIPVVDSPVEVSV